MYQFGLPDNDNDNVFEERIEWASISNRERNEAPRRINEAPNG